MEEQPKATGDATRVAQVIQKPEQVPTLAALAYEQTSRCCPVGCPGLSLKG
jgi:hypothetical protein